MRILFVTTSYPSPVNPTAGIFVHLLAQSLLRKGHQIRVITPGDTTECGVTLFEGIEVERVWYAPRCLRILAQHPGGIPAVLKRKPYFFFILPFLLLFMSIRVARHRAYYEIIHGHWILANIIDMLSSLKKTSTPCVVTLRGADVKIFALRIVREIFFRFHVFHKTFFATVSQSLAEEFLFFLRKERNNIAIPLEIVPNGIEKEFFAIEPCDGSQPTKFLYIGSLIPRKRVDQLIEACKIALNKGRHFHLKIVGEGPEKEKIIHLIQQYHLQNYVTIMPYVPHSHIPSLLQDAHAFILFSTSEGRPNVAIEAMAAGRALLATDLACIRELIGDHDCGYVAPLEDLSAQADMLIQACDHRERLRHMGENARTRIITLGLDWDRTAEKYESLYREANKRFCEIS